MDTTTELAARAAAYLALAQEASRQSALKYMGMKSFLSTPATVAAMPSGNSWKQMGMDWLARNEMLIRRAGELGNTVLTATAENDANAELVARDTTAQLIPVMAAPTRLKLLEVPALAAFDAVQVALLTLVESWLTPGEQRRLLARPPGRRSSRDAAAGLNLTISAEAWRQWLIQLLYRRPAYRTWLAHTLRLVPELVQTALTAPVPTIDTTSDQAVESALSDAEYVTLTHEFFQTDFGSDPAFSPTRAASFRRIVSLLEDDTLLRDRLTRVHRPLPFSMVQAAELADIRSRRAAHRLSFPESAADSQRAPHRLAQQAKLVGLAFSGGGIRSATFNLGILHRLAQVGWLPQIDYLSTVSGGGYIGSWLAAWVLRLGSLTDVATRLDKYAAPNPRAEETRPVRWLRQYSNYLTPRASALSVDTWTAAVTWLRNTLLNQLVLFLTLGGVLGVLFSLLGYWFSNGIVGNLAADQSVAERGTAWIAVIFVMSALAGLASLGMQVYHRGLGKGRLRRWQQAAPGAFAVVAGYGCFLCAAAFRREFPPASILTASARLWPIGLLTFGLLMAVAAAGRYDKCFTDRRGWYVWGRLLIASLLASMAGVWCLALAWQGIGWLRGCSSLLGQPASEIGSRLTFVFGPPLVLEAGVLTVVLRMGLLGSHFPDERREWWGRLGGLLHLVIVGWVILSAAVVLSGPLSALVVNWSKSALATFGGLGALVLTGLRYAQGPTTSAQPTEGPAPSRLGWLLTLAPLVFLLTAIAGVSLVVNGWLTTPDSWLREIVVGLEWLHPDLAYQSIVDYSPKPLVWIVGGGIVAVLGLGLGILLARALGVNEFSLHHFYRNRLVRAYLGASRRREERDRTVNPFTGFDVTLDDLRLARFRRAPLPDAEKEAPLSRPTVSAYDGPYLIVNAALNATRASDLARQDRMAESFVFSPHFCGFDISRVRGVRAPDAAAEYGFRPTAHYANRDGGPTLGTAMAISGAAANPNSGYHSSAAVGLLLTFFNVRLGWWMGNPSRQQWQRMSPRLGLTYLLKDLFAASRTDDDYVCLSDGGHFDNMGLYELVRRRCRFIILGDGEEDVMTRCEGLATAIRNARIDFGVEIKIDVSQLQRPAGQRHSEAHFAVGTIYYPDGPTGYLLYLKASLTGDEPTDVREYAQQNPTFPHQPTLPDQFFSEAQFESYRRLGIHVASDAMRALAKAADPSSKELQVPIDFPQALLAYHRQQRQQKRDARSAPTNNTSGDASLDSAVDPVPGNA